MTVIPEVVQLPTPEVVLTVRNVPLLIRFKLTPLNDARPVSSVMAVGFSGLKPE